MKYLVKIVRVRDNVFLDGIGDCGKVLPGSKLRGAELTYTPNGLEIRHKGKLAILPLSEVIVADGASEVLVEHKPVIEAADEVPKAPKVKVSSGK